MALSGSTMLFLLLACALWVAEARQYNSILTVQNGGKLGQWGPAQFCYRGHAVGFLLKVELMGMECDATALNGISLFCDDGTRITSTSASWGEWSKLSYCHQGKLVSFALRVQDPLDGDNTAANNIKFRCSDDSELKGTGNPRGSYGNWSRRCTKGFICGIQTRVHTPQFGEDDTALNDVRMFCCD